MWNMLWSGIKQKKFCSKETGSVWKGRKIHKNGLMQEKEKEKERKKEKEKKKIERNGHGMKESEIER